MWSVSGLYSSAQYVPVYRAQVALPAQTLAYPPGWRPTGGNARRKASVRMVQATDRPLDAGWAARRKFSCDELTSTAGQLWWIQSDPDLAGAARVMRWSGSGQPAAVTPVDVQVGSWLHAYGGGSFAVSDQKLWYIDARNSSVWQLDMKSGERRRAVPTEDGAFP